MELEQEFELSIAPDLVWAAFQDIELLVTCLPGASLTGPAADGEDLKDRLHPDVRQLPGGR